jgi:hypothetical protein
MTLEELHVIEAIEADARDKAKSAKQNADAARIEHGNNLLSDAGIVIGETICEFSPWSFSSEVDRGIILGVFPSGMAVVAGVTSKGEIHKSRNNKAVYINKLQIVEPSK